MAMAIKICFWLSVRLGTAYFAENWKQLKKNWLLFINEFTVHMPDCTVYVPWTVQEALDLKKNKN